MRGFLRVFRGLVVLGLLGIVLSQGQSVARAGVAGYEADFTLTSGTSSISTTMTLAGSEIKDVLLWCPTLNAADTATATLTLNVLGQTGFAPRGWSDKVVGATADNAVIQCNSSVLDIYCDNTVTFTMTTSSTQTAPRAFKVFFLVEH